MTLFQWEIWACFAATRCSYQGIIVVLPAVCSSCPAYFVILSWMLSTLFCTARKQVPHGPVPGHDPVITDRCHTSLLKKYLLKHRLRGDLCVIALLLTFKQRTLNNTSGLTT